MIGRALVIGTANRRGLQVLCSFKLTSHHWKSVFAAARYVGAGVSKPRSANADPCWLRSEAHAPALMLHGSTFNRLQRPAACKDHTDRVLIVSYCQNPISSEPKLLLNSSSPLSATPAHDAGSPTAQEIAAVQAAHTQGLA